MTTYTKTFLTSSTNYGLDFVRELKTGAIIVSVQPVFTKEGLVDLITFKGKVKKMTSELQYKISDGGKAESSWPDEQGDCTVRAYANVSGISYDLAHEALKILGGREDYDYGYFHDFAEKTGTLHPVDDTRYSYTIIDMLRKYHTGHYIFKIPSHVFAIIDGVVIDDQPPYFDDMKTMAIWEYKL